MLPRRSCAVLGAALGLGLSRAAGATDYYVSGSAGNDSNPGTALSQPFRTIQRAANAVGAGDRILIRGGTYREQITFGPGHGGTAAAPVIVQPYGDDQNGYESVYIHGSEPVTGWQPHLRPDGVTIYKRPNWTINSQQVFFNFHPLTQVGPTAFPADRYTPVAGDQNTMGQNSFCWSGNTLYVRLPEDVAPGATNVLASVRPFLLRMAPDGPNAVGAPYITVRKLWFLHCNSSAGGQPGEGIVLSSHSTLDNCTVQWCDFAGVSMGYQQTGSAVINSYIGDNGAVGIQSAQTRNFLVRNCRVERNKYRPFRFDWHAGGMKFTSNSWGTVEGNTVTGHGGSRGSSGIWFDFCRTDNPSVIRGNRVHGCSAGAGIFFEISRNGTLCGNLVESCASGIRVAASEDAEVCHNTVVGADGYAAIEVGQMPRLSPPSNLMNNSVHDNEIRDAGKAKYDLLMFRNNNLDPAQYPGYAVRGNRSDANRFTRSQCNEVFRFGLGSVTPGAPGPSATVYTTLRDFTAASGYDATSTISDPCLGVRR